MPTQAPHCFHDRGCVENASPPNWTMRACEQHSHSVTSTHKHGLSGVIVASLERRAWELQIGSWGHHVQGIKRARPSRDRQGARLQDSLAGKDGDEELIVEDAREGVGLVIYLPRIHLAMLASLSSGVTRWLA